MADLPLDAFGALFIFLIGVPAFVVQFMPPEIRRIVMKRWPTLLVDTGLPVALAVGAFGVGVAVALGWVKMARLQPSLWLAVFAFLYGLAAYSATRIPYRYGRRESIVWHLAREVGRRRNHPARLNEAALQDLIALGRQSDPGYDKELVLTALNELTEQVCAHPAYRGDSLETLILGLVEIVAADPQPGSPPNFVAVAAILQRVALAYTPTTGTPQVISNRGVGARATLHRLRHRGVAHAAASPAPMRDTDIIYAVQTLNKLAQAAFVQVQPNIELEALLMRYIGALKLGYDRHPALRSDVSQALLEVGGRATREGQTLVALGALTSLRDMAAQHPASQGEEIKDLLGLTARFWAAGPSAREFARSYLPTLASHLAQPLPAALDAARRHYLITAHFDIADELAAMMGDLKGDE